MTQNFSFDFNFFEEDQILGSIQTHLNIQKYVLEHHFFGMIGMSKNGFYEVFNQEKYYRNKSFILSIEQTKNNHYIDIGLNDGKDIDTMLFFSSTKDKRIEQMIETSLNFEFVVLLFSKEEFNSESIEKRHKKRFTFRSMLSRRRWITSQHFVEIDFNVLHNRCGVIISS